MGTVTAGRHRDPGPVKCNSCLCVCCAPAGKEPPLAEGQGVVNSLRSSRGGHSHASFTCALWAATQSLVHFQEGRWHPVGVGTGALHLFQLFALFTFFSLPAQKQVFYKLSSLGISILMYLY